jgi:hypothetical protein
MKTIILGSIYWGLISIVYLALSPLIILTGIAQIFTDVGFKKIISVPFEGWQAALKDIENMDVKRENTKKWSFLDSLPPGAKQELQKIIDKSGYDPDQDPKASHHKYYYKPSFTIPNDDNLRNDLKAKWVLEKALSVANHPYFTRSYWDAVGSQKLYELFIDPYVVPDVNGVEIHNANEHRWLLETWSLPFYEVEYQLEMLKWLHNVNPKIMNTKEFMVRYKLLDNMLRRLERVHSKFSEPYKKAAKSYAARASTGSMINGLWDLYFSYKKANLFLDQCEYFENEARKSRNV